MKQVEMIPGIVFVVADEEPLPTVEQPQSTLPTPPTGEVSGGIPVPLAIAAAVIAALAIVALPAAIFGWFSSTVLFGMLLAALVSMAFVVVTYPVPDNQLNCKIDPIPSTQRVSAQYAVCTPSRNTLTGRPQ